MTDCVAFSPVGTLSIALQLRFSQASSLADKGQTPRIRHDNPVPYRDAASAMRHVPTEDHVED
jgi:hypothetical protein